MIMQIQKNTGVSPNSRNSSVELLRIIAMLFIVLSHCCIHSGFDITSSGLSFNKLFIYWGFLGNLGVDIFILITGYYLCRKRNNLHSVIRLLPQVWFYSIVLFLVCRFGFGYTYSSADLLTVLFPTIFEEYWFFTAYVILVLLCPYINILLAKLDRHSHACFIGIMLVLWVLIPTFTPQDMYGGPLTQFLMFYSIGAYFQLYPDNYFSKKTPRVWLLTGSFFLLYFSTFVLDYLNEHVGLWQYNVLLIYRRESLLIVGCAVGLFTAFIYRKAYTCPWINTLASCTFGVYLIHDHPAVREIIWVRILKNADYFYSPMLIARIIASALLVFGISSLIEYLRLRCLGKVFDWLANRLTARIAALVKHR